jgi:hypothetical protein
VYEHLWECSLSFMVIKATCIPYIMTLLKAIHWLIYYLRFYIPLKNFLLIWRRHHCRWKAAKFRPMLGAQGLLAGRDLYRATPAATRDRGYSGLIRRTAPFSRLLRHTRGCGGSILTWQIGNTLWWVVRKYRIVASNPGAAQNSKRRRQYSHLNSSRIEHFSKI